MNDYERIARAIRYLDEHQCEQPSLATLSARAGLSPFHFHRLFSAWSGVTPKDFLQCLTLAHVKRSLLGGKSVLESALDAGLSGPGRLHDLCVSLEAASPGQIKNGGKYWTISAGFADSPFGACLIAESPRGICHLSFVEPDRGTDAWRELREEWPQARVARNDRWAGRIAPMIFQRPQPGGRGAPLRAFVRGTPFQLRVWRALIHVPPGRLTTYGRLAARMGMPTAARAVGSAVAANPIAFLIPCHRVIRETGVVGDYRWGGVRKRAILAWENAAQMAGSTPGNAIGK